MEKYCKLTKSQTKFLLKILSLFFAIFDKFKLKIITSTEGFFLGDYRTFLKINL